MTADYILPFLVSAIPVLGGAALSFGLYRVNMVEQERAKEQAQLEHERAKIEQERLQAENISADLRQQVADYRQRTSLMAEEDELRLQMEDLTQKVHELRQEQRTLDLTRGELKGLEAQLERVEVEWAQKRDLLHEINGKLADFERIRYQYDTLTGEIDGLKQEAASLQTEARSLKHERESLEQELRRVQVAYQEVDARRRELLELQKATRDEQDKLEALKREVLEVEILVGDRKAQVKEVEARLQQLREDVARRDSDVELALKTFQEPLFPKSVLPAASMTESAFLDGFAEYLARKELKFSRRLINAFHTALKIQDISSLVVLAGISGTGKSQLPQQYSSFAGIDFVLVPVQPRWDSPQDLLGFYNYMEKQYKPTELVRALRQFAEEPQRQDRLLIVLLDEMNLARVEYYFSDFLSKLEARRSHSEQSFVELDLGNLQVAEDRRRLRLSDRILFVGTMNEDESTQTLSDKVLDRATVLTFPKPKHLQLKSEASKDSERAVQTIAASTFIKIWSARKPLGEHEAIIQAYLEKANSLLSELDRPFGHRVSQGVFSYVSAYPGTGSGDTDVERDAVRMALADQFAQKIITKLRGLPLEPTTKNLLQRFANEVLTPIGDTLLLEAFQTAYDHDGHTFQWKGLAYQVKSDDNELNVVAPAHA